MIGNVDWTGQLSKAAKAGARGRDRAGSAGDDLDEYSDKPYLLTGWLAIVWYAFLSVLFLTINVHFGVLVTIACARRCKLIRDWERMYK